MDQIEQLLRYALRIKDETLIAQIKKAASIRHIAKGNHWARRGDALPGVTFLISGMFRFYFLDSKGREHVDCFCGEFGYPVMPAIDFNMPLPINVQALEDSTVLHRTDEAPSCLPNAQSNSESITDYTDA